MIVIIVIVVSSLSYNEYYHYYLCFLLFLYIYKHIYIHTYMIIHVPCELFDRLPMEAMAHRNRCLASACACSGSLDLAPGW